MSPESGESLMLWTVRCSVAFYGVALHDWMFPSDSSKRRYSICWLLSWMLCVIHVLCAFHFRHEWNHEAAIQHTTEMTWQVTGINWGGGLYINYVFLVTWGFSAIRAAANGSLQPGKTLDTFFHAFAAFMMFNATAVFGPSWWWIPVLCLIALIGWKKTHSEVRKNAVEQTVAEPVSGAGPESGSPHPERSE